MPSADVILGLEVRRLLGARRIPIATRLHAHPKPITKDGAKLINITASDLYKKSNYQDFQRYTEVDLAIAADAEATMPALIEAVKRLLTDDRKRAFEDRGKKLAAAADECIAAFARRSRLRAGTPAPSPRRASAAEIWGADQK